MKLASRTDRTRVVDILSASFDDNQSINYLIKQDAKRKQRLRHLMEYCFDVCLMEGAICLDEEEVACMLILDSEKKGNSWRKLLLDIRLVWKSIGVRRIPKVQKREKVLRANHPKEPFYYLWFVGVEPIQQGKGKGNALLQEALKICDEQKRPVYLETSVLRNLPWYERFGFDIFNELDLGYRLYQMLRP